MNDTAYLFIRSQLNILILAYICDIGGVINEYIYNVKKMNCQFDAFCNELAYCPHCMLSSNETYLYMTI